MPSPSRVDVRAATVDDVPALGTIYREASLSNAGDRDVLLANPAALVAPAATRRGTATLLIRDAQDVARNLGCEFLAVTANPHAAAFYAAAGFRGGEVVQTEFGAGERLTLQV